MPMSLVTGEVSLYAFNCFPCLHKNLSYMLLSVYIYINWYNDNQPFMLSTNMYCNNTKCSQTTCIIFPKFYMKGHVIGHLLLVKSLDQKLVKALTCSKPRVMLYRVIFYHVLSRASGIFNPFARSVVVFAGGIAGLWSHINRLSEWAIEAPSYCSGHLYTVTKLSVAWRTICLYVYTQYNICTLLHSTLKAEILLAGSWTTKQNPYQNPCIYQGHDDVIKWKHFPRCWPFVRGIHGNRWIPRTKASDAELYSASE